MSTDPLFGDIFEGLLPAPWPTAVIIFFAIILAILSCIVIYCRRGQNQRTNPSGGTKVMSEAQRDYYEDAVREGFAAAGGRRLITSEGLRIVLATVIDREPTADEFEGLNARCLMNPSKMKGYINFPIF